MSLSALVVSAEEPVCVAARIGASARIACGLSCHHRNCKHYLPHQLSLSLDLHCSFITCRSLTVIESRLRSVHAVRVTDPAMCCYVLLCAGAV